MSRPRLPIGPARKSDEVVRREKAALRRQQAATLKWIVGCLLRKGLTSGRIDALVLAYSKRGAAKRLASEMDHEWRRRVQTGSRDIAVAVVLTVMAIGLLGVAWLGNSRPEPGTIGPSAEVKQRKGATSD